MSPLRLPFRHTRNDSYVNANSLFVKGLPVKLCVRTEAHFPHIPENDFLNYLNDVCHTVVTHNPYKTIDHVESSRSSLVERP